MRVVIARSSFDIEVDEALLQQQLGTQVHVKKSTIWRSSAGSPGRSEITADELDAGPR